MLCLRNTIPKNTSCLNCFGSNIIQTFFRSINILIIEIIHDNKGKVGNIDYGNIDFEKVIIENGNIEFRNSKIRYGRPWGGVGGGDGGG